MDAISLLDTTARILAVTESITELSSSLASPRHTHRYCYLDTNDERTLLETLERLRTTLFDIRIPHVPQSSSASPSTPSSNALVLRELLYPQQASARLLENISTLGKSPGQPWRSFAEELERITRAVTLQVISTLRSRISELSQTVESSDSEKQYTKPEFESRIDSVARELEDLRLQVQKLSARPNAGTSAALTETNVTEFMTRLASLADSGNALLADNILSSLIKLELRESTRPARLA